MFSNSLDVLTGDHKPVFSVFNVETSLLKIARDLRWDDAQATFTDLDVEIFSETRARAITFKVLCPVFEQELIQFTAADVDNELDPIALKFSNLKRIKQYFLVFEVLNGEKSLGGRFLRDLQF
jgi:hypothetical protein